MEVIYLFTVLWLKEPDTYSDSVVANAYINKADCLETLDTYELQYRRQEGKYALERYARASPNGSGEVIGFSIKDKASKDTSFYECQTVFLLDR